MGFFSSLFKPITHLFGGGNKTNVQVVQTNKQTQTIDFKPILSNISSNQKALIDLTKQNISLQKDFDKRSDIEIKTLASNQKAIAELAGINILVNQAMMAEAKKEINKVNYDTKKLYIGLGLLLLLLIFGGKR